MSAHTERSMFVITCLCFRQQFHEFPDKLPLKKSTVTQKVFNFLTLDTGLGNVSVISEKEVSTSLVFGLNQLV